MSQSLFHGPFCSHVSVSAHLCGVYKASRYLVAPNFPLNEREMRRVTSPSQMLISRICFVTVSGLGVGGLFLLPGDG